jgi:NAD(P)-dependent dehydrogenase (short-subunit alcohol dehydrogenase family)
MSPFSSLEDHPAQIFCLEGRIAFLSGASGHLGKAMAFALCDAGAHVIMNGRDPDKLKDISKALNAKGFSTSVTAFDITNKSELTATVKKITSEYDRLDILVNNAYSGVTGTLETAKLEDFMSAYQVSVGAAFYLIQQFTPLLKNAAKTNLGGASVINISSMYGTVSPNPSIYGESGMNNPPHYGSAKAGLIQLTRYAACHLAPYKIRVNCISPGPFPPPEIETTQPEFYKALCMKNPMGRIGLSKELTGVNIPVDGGWTSW